MVFICLLETPLYMRFACQSVELDIHLFLAITHVIELFELEEPERLGFMKEVQCYAHALKTITEAVKISYEIHGNSAPYLHLHLYPHYLDDPFTGRAIDYHQKKRLYEPGAFEAFVRQMQETVAASRSRFAIQPISKDA